MIDLTVVGAGPAGLQAAISAGAAMHAAAGKAAYVLLIEAMTGPARKLLITGSGQCNITHTGSVGEFLDRYAAAGRFLKPALWEFPPEALLDQFRAEGMRFETEASGKIFPASRRARDVRDLLLQGCKTYGVELLTSRRISAVEAIPRGFRLSTGRESFDTRSLILACGGASYPGTGSDGSGFRLVRELGHTLIEPRPGLTDAVIDPFPLSDLAGISLPGCRIVLKRDDRGVASLEGDLLITHRGFSGPVILDGSRLMQAGDRLRPDFSGLGKNAETELLRWIERNGKRRLLGAAELFSAPERLFAALLREQGIAPDSRAAELSRSERHAVLTALCSIDYPIRKLGGFKRAMVTVGGVSREEINPKTMESRLVPGLYFAGEMIDIDGDSGGFNLQAAFSTGHLAGESAARSLGP